MIVLRSNSYLSNFRKDGIVIIFSIWPIELCAHFLPHTTTTTNNNTTYGAIPYMAVSYFFSQILKFKFQKILAPTHLSLSLSIYPHIRSYIYLKTIIISEASVLPHSYVSNFFFFTKTILRLYESLSLSLSKIQNTMDDDK